MQSVLGNPLASPFTLGVSSAAGFGASLAIVAGHSLLADKLAIIGNAFVFAMGANLIVYILAASLGASPLLIVLAGMGINFLFSSLTTLLHYFSTPEAVYRALFWTSGSLSISSWDSVLTLFIVLSISLIVVWPLLYDLSLVVEGDAWAMVVGVDVYKVRLSGLLIASVLAAVTVSFVGVIGFIGLVAPHLCRLAGMEDPRGLIPLSAITGGTLLILADLAATRLAAPIVLPVGAVTSLLGVAFLAAFALSKRMRM
jgi:iron complex transport system permease protein